MARRDVGPVRAEDENLAYPLFWEDEGVMMCFDEWSSCVLANCGHYYGTPVRRQHRRIGNFRMRRHHGVDIAEIDCRIDRLERLRAGIRRDESEHLFLLLQRCGESTIVHNDRTEFLTPGDCIVLDSTRVAELWVQGKEVTWTSVHLPRALCFEGGKPAPVSGRRVGRSHPLLASLHNLLPQNGAEEGVGEGVGGADYLIDFVMLMFRADAPSGYASGFRDRNTRFRFICETVERHLSDAEFSIDRLSSLVNMSRRQLQRDFRDNGTTFTRVLNDRRVRLIASHLRRAAQADSRPIIAELAYRAGFNDLSHVNRTFRDHYGQSPRAYHAGCKLEVEDR